jgi:hypothetical protein
MFCLYQFIPGPYLIQLRTLSENESRITNVINSWRKYHGLTSEDIKSGSFAFCQPDSETSFLSHILLPKLLTLPYIGSARRRLSGRLLSINKTVSGASRRAGKQTFRVSLFCKTYIYGAGPGSLAGVGTSTLYVYPLSASDEQYLCVIY